MLIIIGSVALMLAGLIALLAVAVRELRQDRWLSNLLHHQRAEWARGVDLPYWRLPKERG